jgi:menaquinol-cytochrome c reductase iron-sulfur subunit
MAVWSDRRQIHGVEAVEEGTDPAVVSRRTFLKYAVGAVGAFIGIVSGVPIVGYLGSVFQAKGRSQWVKLGRIEQFSDPAPQSVQFTLAQQDGWVETREARSCWVIREGDKLAVFNGRCTHLGCAYSWQNEGQHKDRFFCPCHEGVYDRGGYVVGGPPPRPLDRLETKVEDDELLVLYQDFHPGVPEKMSV